MEHPNKELEQQQLRDDLRRIQEPDNPDQDDDYYVLRPEQHPRS